MIENITIKSWAEDDRPREKLLLKGKHNLSDSELIAIILGSGSREKSAVELARDLLSSVSNNLSLLGKLTHNELTKFKGIGDAKAISILAALEIGRRRKDAEPEEKQKITKSNQAYELVRHIFQDLTHEVFYVAMLNRANQLISIEFISSGGFAGTVVDGKMIFKKALEKSAQTIILYHNHPSGQLQPSSEDLKITKDLKEFAKIIDISILDHIIFTDNGYFSFADQGLMN